MAEACYLGFDIGSSSLKGLLADHDGQVLYAAACEYQIAHPEPGWAEEDPLLWWNGVMGIIGQMVEACPQIRTALRGIFVSGMVPNLVALDAAGDPVRPAILYRDNRAVRECLDANAAWDTDFNLQDIIPKWLWIKNTEADNYRRIALIMSSHSYVVYKLTGCPNSDIDTAALFGKDAISAGGSWNEALFTSLGLDTAPLPPLFNPGAVVGRLDAAIASRFGIRADVQVFAGIGDSFSSMLGTGVVKAGDAMLYLGTAATLWLLDTDLEAIVRQRIFGSGRLHFIGNTLSGGESLNWFRDSLQLNCRSMPLSELERSAEELPIGAQGLVALPHLMGKRTPQADPFASGALLGLSPNHTGYHVYRALMEGVAFNLYDSYRQSGLTIRHLAVTGGGAVSRLWKEILCSVFDRDIAYHPNSTAALGNAFFAAYCLGDHGNFETFRSGWLDEPQIMSPDPEKVAAYRRAFERYQQLDQHWSQCNTITEECPV